MTYRPANIGDSIQYRGKLYTIAEIIDQWEDYEDEDLSFHGIECRTTDGQYRMWKQRWDGGKLIRIDDKETIATELGKLLKLTRQFSDLDTCEYVKDDHDDEWVILKGLPNSTGYRWTYRVNVNWDSGIAMLKDVLRQIG